MWSEQALETQPAHCPERAHPTPGMAGAPGMTHSGHVAPAGGAPGWGAGPSWGAPHWPDGTLPPKNLPLEGLQELLQDTLSPGRVLQASQWLSCKG